MKFSFVVITATATLLHINPSFAADIRMLASGATEEVVAEVMPAYEKSSGNKVIAKFTGSANIKKQIAAGEVYDILISGSPDIDGFIQQGKITPGSRTDLMKSGIGVAIRAGAPKPDIRSADGIKSALLAAKSVGYSTGPSGDYLVSLTERMGIADQIKPKLKQVPSGERIGDLIASGKAEIGFQQISELIHASGVDYLGPLPPDIQKITIYSAGIPVGAKQQEATAMLIKSF